MWSVTTLDLNAFKIGNVFPRVLINNRFFEMLLQVYIMQTIIKSNVEEMF